MTISQPNGPVPTSCEVTEVQCALPGAVDVLMVCAACRRAARRPLDADTCSQVRSFGEHSRTLVERRCGHLPHELNTPPAQERWRE